MASRLSAELFTLREHERIIEGPTHLSSARRCRLQVQRIRFQVNRPRRHPQSRIPSSKKLTSAIRYKWVSKSDPKKYTGQHERQHLAQVIMDCDKWQPKGL